MTAKDKTEPKARQILIATESFSKRHAGSDHQIAAGQTLVEEGHPILKGVEHLFAPVEAHYKVGA